MFRCNTSMNPILVLSLCFSVLSGTGQRTCFQIRILHLYLSGTLDDCSSLMVRTGSVLFMNHGQAMIGGKYRCGTSCDFNCIILAHSIQSKLPPGAEPLCFILYADKSKLSSFGTAKGYPVIARCANLPVEVRNGDGLGGGRVVGWLPVVSLPSCLHTI